MVAVHVGFPGRLLLLLLAAAIGCSEGARPEGDAASDLVNPGAVSHEPACEISLALERATPLPAVSQPGTEGDALNYDAVRFARFMADGGAVVASRTLPRLTLFDGMGDPLRRIGRLGAGPGDFWASRPIPREEVDGWISDYLERETPATRAWVDPQIRELPFPDRTPAYDGVGIAWDGAREVFWVPEHRPSDPAADTLRLSIVDVWVIPVVCAPRTAP